MAGWSLTITKLDDEILGLWDAPVRTPALRWGPLDLGWASAAGPRPTERTRRNGETRVTVDAALIRAWVAEMAAAVAAERDHLTSLDAAIGDATTG